MKFFTHIVSVIALLILTSNAVAAAKINTLDKKGAKLRNCIVDKHITIPEGMAIGYNRGDDEKSFTVSPNGVTVVGKDFNS